MPRQRGYGEGYIEERTNKAGEVSYRVQIRLPGGGRKNITAKSYREATQICQDMLVAARSGHLSASKRQTVLIEAEASVPV